MQRLAQMRARLVQMSEELRAANAQLEELSSVDAMTGLMNRRPLDARLQQELDLARRDGKPLTLMLCDVDHFKRYNDAAGHVAGDACLRRIGQLLKETCAPPERLRRTLRRRGVRAGPAQHAALRRDDLRPRADAHGGTGRDPASGFADRRDDHALRRDHHLPARRQHRRPRA